MRPSLALVCLVTLTMLIVHAVIASTTTAPDPDPRIIWTPRPIGGAVLINPVTRDSLVLPPNSWLWTPAVGDPGLPVDGST